MAVEKWVDVPSNPRYQVSDLGRVRHAATNRIKAISKPKLLKDGRRSYPSVMLWNGVANRIHRVHRLVAQAHLPDFNSSLTVNHKDGDITNNRADNLEIISVDHNIKHYFTTTKNQRRYGVHKYTKGDYQYWVAMIRNKGRREPLGYFKDKEEAYSAYRLRYKEIYGEFPWD